MELITESLQELLDKNNYNPVTIKFYEREWKRIKVFCLKNLDALRMTWNAA